MSKPNFSQLTRQELKSYIRQHPTDDEAIRELFVHRRHPDAKVFLPVDNSLIVYSVKRHGKTSAIELDINQRKIYSKKLFTHSDLCTARFLALSC